MDGIKACGDGWGRKSDAAGMETISDGDGWIQPLLVR